MRTGREKASAGGFFMLAKPPAIVSQSTNALHHGHTSIANTAAKVL
jgi:hypothetical protein